MSCYQYHSDLRLLCMQCAMWKMIELSLGSLKTFIIILNEYIVECGIALASNT